jgi:drug/metabolite transporter (DMT)-like permease
MADIGGFALQAAALRHGSLIVVQPLLTTSLLFTLVIAAQWSHERITMRQWAAVGLVLASLGAFLAVASPSDHSASAGPRAWLFCASSVVGVVIVLVSAGLRSSTTARAALFGAAAGIADAFMATLAKALSSSLDHGVVAAARGWAPYAVVVAGVTALLLVSTAYQAGHPTVTLSVITVTDPVVASLIGVTLFGEHLEVGGTRGWVVALAAAGMLTGLLALTRDDRLAGRFAQDGSGGPADLPAEDHGERGPTRPRP